MKLIFEISILVVFFAVFKLVGIYPAIGCVMALYTGQIMFQLLRGKTVETVQWLTLGMVLVLGGASLFFHNELFFKWKPSVVYLLFTASILIAPRFTGTPTLQKLMGQQLDLPLPVWQQLDKAWALFFAITALLNLLVAYSFPTETWVYFKLFGSIILITLFILAQAFWLAPHLKKQEHL